jgi:hypothetical protein
MCRNSKSQGLLYTAVFGTLFVAVVDDQFLYMFDYLDALFGLLFAYGVVHYKSISYFVPLFLISIFNREQALFIPLWLILSSTKKENKKISVDNKQMITGILLIALGVLYTKFSRDLLYVGGKYWMGMDDSHKSIGNFVIPFENLRNLFAAVQSFLILNDGMPQWVPFIILGVPLYFIYFHKNYFVNNPTISILVLSQMAAIMTFAVIFETRTFTCLIPFLTMIDCSSRTQNLAVKAA